MAPDGLTHAFPRRKASCWGAIFGAMGGAAFAGTVTLLIPGAVFLWLGVPVSTFLGWALGPAAAARQPLVALRMALGCTTIGALLTGILLASTVEGWVVDRTSLAANLMVQGLAYGAFGILIFGLPSTFILWAVSEIWAALVRGVAASSARPPAGMQGTPRYRGPLSCVWDESA